MYSQRQSSIAGSIHAIGGVLDTTRGDLASDVWETGQNAISTLLQPPASSAHKPPTAHDIPPVPLTDIQHVDTAEFEPYLHHLGALHEQMRKAKKDILERSSETGDFTAVFDNCVEPGNRSSGTRKGSVPSISSMTLMDRPGPAPLSTIPAVYFDEHFHLENPRTFDIVSERSEVVRPSPGVLDKRLSETGNTTAPRKTLATNAILQERLSWYIDTVEMHLITSISTALTSFFAVLGSLQHLHSRVSETVDRVKSLTQELGTLDREIVINGLDLIHKRQRQRNVLYLYNAVVQMNHIVDGVAACQSLVEHGETEKALEGIESLEKLVAGELDPAKPSMMGPSFPSRDLRHARALQGVPGDLAVLRLRIGKAYEAHFLGLLLRDLRGHVDAVPNQEVLIRWVGVLARLRGHAQDAPLPPSYSKSTDELRSDLQRILAGLYRARHLTAAATSYRETALKEIRSLVRRPLPSSNDDDNESASAKSLSTAAGGRPMSQQEKSAVLARNLRALMSGDAEELLVKIFVTVTETLRRVTTQVKLLLDVASSLGDNSSLDEIHRAIDLPSLLSEAVDVSQDRVAKLLRVRSEQTTCLSRIWFLRYFTLNVCFVSECESISGRGGTAIKTVVNGQIKDFVRHCAKTESQLLTREMESDQWEIKDFIDEDTAELNRILSCSTTDPAEWSDVPKIWIPYSGNDPGPCLTTDNRRPDVDSRAAKFRRASIDDESFVLPNSAIVCMHGLSHFLQLTVAIPSKAPDIGILLVSYLLLFSNCCTRLILEAEARQTAGLKNITSKHLVLAAQALAFISTLITNVCEFFRRHAASAVASSSFVEFDRVKRLYQVQQDSIFDKLVEIMSRLAASHVEAMKKIDWNDNDGHHNVHPCMAMLARDTTSLYRILSRMLPQGLVHGVMGPVFVTYEVQLSQAFRDAQPETESGRDRMLRDVKFLESKLGAMDGFGSLGEHLTRLIESKQVQTAVAGKAMAELEQGDTTEPGNKAR